MTALLIILPRGLGVSGVTTWGLRLAGGLAARGRRVGILTSGGDAARALIPPGVDAFVHGELPIDNLRGDLSAILPAYREAIDGLAADGPTVVSPNLHGDCYGAAIEAARGRDDARVVGWQHSDIAYDAHVLRWYAPALSHIVAVSSQIQQRLSEWPNGWPPGWPDAPRRAPISLIPYGIEVPSVLPQRPPATARPLRLLYAGRLEHEQKRAGALAPMMQELAAAGIAAHLTVAGDGPARADLETTSAGAGDIHLIGPVPPSRIGALLDDADCFILPSRYEGLSVAMLEAMARGSIPIVARVASGLDDAVRDGASAIIADIGPEADPQQTGAAMARAVRRAIELGLPRLNAGAHAAAAPFSLDRHLDRVEALLDHVAASPPPTWPADRPAAFSAWHDRYGSGSVPPGGPARLARALDALHAAGARIAIHSAGEHTRQLAHIIEPRLKSIVCFCDDNPAARGQRLLARPVIAPAEAGSAGATHAVISSWLHEGDIWRRRDIYERQGVTLLRLYH